ncbi:hypothetical protein CI102_13625 [Trichoderma harzianum]|nr:hypothetical protein CI102_13625 [Trichoderma harzianum]
MDKYLVRFNLPTKVTTYLVGFGDETRNKFSDCQTQCRPQGKLVFWNLERTFIIKYKLVDKDGFYDDGPVTPKVADRSKMPS